MAAALQAAAAPPGWFPLAALLVIPGLALQYALAVGERRPLLASYLFGVLYTGAFSWSLRHVLLPGWAAIALVGGIYTLLCAVAVRSMAPRLGGPIAFAVALAGSCWLRAEMPEIWYPHGQPCHDFWRWPWLLGLVRLGGEPLANGWLGAFAAALVVGRQRARANPANSAYPANSAMSGARPLWAVALVGVSLSIGFAPVAPAAATETVDVAAVEPGVHPTDWLEGIDSQRAMRERWQGLFREHWVQPTLRLLGADAQSPRPDLVLWPESSVPVVMRAEPPMSPPAAVDHVLDLFGLGFAEDARLCIGALVRLPDVSRPTPAALLVDGHGAMLAHHEKRRLVPAGEFLPLVGLLPKAVAEWIRNGIAQVFGGEFEAEPGRVLPPLQTKAGVPFAALLCYDNAFPTTVATEVAQGARFLVVLSNESWYRGGAELDQLAAITVLRAIATETPIVRCTTDGRTLAVDASGRILAELPQQTAPAAPRVLRVAVPLGGGRLPGLAGLHPVLGWACALVVVLQAAISFRRRRRYLAST
jgi:apolipoprotein N-acyltransferase